jgi:undecaprenyl-diphosphatase
MTLTQSAVLGAVQGLTELLPVSSSAHLALVSKVFHWPDEGLTYDVALHWGTLAALVAYFWRDLWGLAKAAVSREPSPERRLAWGLCLGTLPAAAAGVLVEHRVEALFRSPAWIAAFLIAFGILLGAVDRLARKQDDLRGFGLLDCLWVGLAQCLALLPGVSRSGITLTAALLLGLRRVDAVRFSFLLSIPIVFGAGVLKLRHLDPAALDASFWTGILVSAGTGLAAIAFMMRFVRERSLLAFAVYRVAAGALVLLFL